MTRKYTVGEYINIAYQEKSGVMDFLMAKQIVKTKEKYKLYLKETMENTIKIGDEVIDLNLPFPREMEVSQSFNGDWEPREVICINSTGINAKIIAIADNKKKFKTSVDIITWEYCREIPKKKQMTVEEIEEKLGHRVEVISKD